MSRAPRSAAARRDWGSDDVAASILHVDMDAFFAEVELLSRPGLRGRPVIVGSDGRGVVLSATYEARASGVHAAMPLRRAMALCPSAVVIPPTHERYGQVAQKVMAILTSVTPIVERVSIDEAFLDVSGAGRRLGGPVRIATEIRRRVREEVGLPASVGVASTKLVAKLASSHAKPDGLLLVPPTAAVAFLHSLPVGSLWGVGEQTAERLADQGIRTVEDLARTPLERLERLLGVTAGRRLLHLAWGRDPRAVEPTREEKSLGTERTFAVDVDDREHVEAVLLDQCVRVAARLRAAGLVARTVSIKIRMADFSTLTRTQTLEGPTDLARALHAAARRLLAGVAIHRDGVRLVGIRVEGLAAASTAVLQPSFDDLDGPNWRGAESATDRIRERYGHGAVTVGSLIRAPATTVAVSDLS